MVSMHISSGYIYNTGKDAFNLDEKAEAKYAADDYGKTSDSG